MDYCHVVHKSGGLHQQLVVYHYYKNTFFILFIYWRFTNELFWDKQSNIKKDQILIWGSCPRHNRKSFLTVSALIRKSSTQSRFISDYLQNLGVERMEWRACSPDLNPTETLLDQLGSARVTNTTMVARLILVEDAIPQQCVTKLVTSMRRMCQALVAVY